MLLTAPEPLLAALLLALAVDWLIGDPPWLWRRLPHPVVAIGRLITTLETRLLDPAASPASQRRRGLATTLLVLAATTAAALALQTLCDRLPHGWLLLGILMSTTLAWHGLHQHVAAVATGLTQSLAAGRRAVALIVGRDPDSLDAPAVARAAIESTAENFADGVVAPVLYGALLGLPGMLVYKAINTLDSMIGHRSPRHLHFGRFAARLDDVASWLPSRFAALLILAAALCLPGGTPAAGWAAMFRDAPRHRSINAGWPEAAMAGSLGLRLAGPRRYGGEVVGDAWMGAGRADASPCDIRAALRLLVLGCVAAAAPIAVLAVAVV